MRPSEVRRRVLDDHERLVRDLSRIEELAVAALERPARLELLRIDAEALIARLREHMHWEESYLLPALRAADAWGAERAEHMTSDHREQRELLDLVVARLRDVARPAELIGRDVAHLAGLLREDMRLEEEELLGEDVLRDDIVAIAVETG